MELKAQGRIRHIGLSTHNPDIACKAAQSGLVEMILFSINPAFDLMPPTDDLEKLFSEASYTEGLNGMDPARAALYRICEQNDVGITVMKPFAGGRLFDPKRSPFGVALTPAAVNGHPVLHGDPDGTGRGAVCPVLPCLCRYRLLRRRTGNV